MFSFFYNIIATLILLIICAQFINRALTCNAYFSRVLLQDTTDTSVEIDALNASEIHFGTFNVDSPTNRSSTNVVPSSLSSLSLGARPGGIKRVTTNMKQRRRNSSRKRNSKKPVQNIPQ